VSEDKKIPSPPPSRLRDMEEKGIDLSTVAEVTTALSASYVAYQNRPKKPPPDPPESPIVLPPGVDKD
jgi:hypothetical protein